MGTKQRALDVELKEDAFLVQIYDKGNFSTYADDTMLYLLTSTKKSKYNVIATIDTLENCTIYNRDKLNVFIDYSHENYLNSIPVDKLRDDQIIEHTVNYLRNDLLSTITFRKCDTQGLLYEVINKYPVDLRTKILDALDKIGITIESTIKYTEAKTEYQAKELFERKMYYACFDLERMKYDITNNDETFSKVFRNGSCGTWGQIANNKNRYAIFFNKSDVSASFDMGIEKQVLEDITKSPYEAVDKFLILEDKFTKAITEITELITNKVGFIDASVPYYPDIEGYTETIVGLIRTYQNSKNEQEKTSILGELNTYYKHTYDELKQSQESLKRLHKVYRTVR